MKVRLRGFKKLTSNFFVFFCAVLVLAPLFLDRFGMNVLLISFIMMAVVVGWNLLIGYAGIFTFGQVATFAVGAYTYTIAVVEYNVFPFLALFLGGSTACLVGLGLGLVGLRVRSVYFALFTFSFHQLLLLILRMWSGVTGGSEGILIPPLAQYQYRIGSLIIAWGTNFTLYYFLSLSMFLGTVLICYKLLHSKFGISLSAIRDSEDFAQSLGINIHKTKLLVFGLVSFITGVLGAHYANATFIVTPDILSLTFLMSLLAMLYLGGVGYFPGSIFGYFFVSYLVNYLMLGSLGYIILGVCMIVVIYLAPGGVGRLYDNIRSKFATK